MSRCRRGDSPPVPGIALKDLTELRRWFDGYVRGFYYDDPARQRNIALKEEHTHRVVAAMNRIAAGIGLSEHDLAIAEATALFHDLGRFRQYRDYGTFRDPESTNHAVLGLRELAASRILHRFDRVDRLQVCEAIFHHNRRFLPERLGERSLLFCRLIRDADKLDIWRVFDEYYRAGERNPVVELGLTESGYVSDSIISAVLDGRVPNYLDLKTTEDFKVLQLSWVFDLNFGPSFAMLRERGYIGKIASYLPDSEKTREMLALINRHVDVMAGGGKTLKMVLFSTHENTA